MKYINKIGVMLSAGLVLAVASCTDYDDYNSVPSLDDSLGAGSTLWENIEKDPQLTKFAELARKSNFKEALNSPRFYTLWAPVDAAFNDADAAAEYNRLMASDSATIVKQFMYQHMTQFNYPISANLDSMTIVSINEKHHPFTQQKFDDFNYIAGAINLPSTNGLMHKIDGVSVYHNNLYENIDQLKDCDKFKEYIQKYDEWYLDLNASVVGPLRDGKQTYLDSVMKKRNNVLSRLMNAKIDNEDSTYCMIIPNDKAWSAAYDTIAKRYNYIPKLDYMDLTKKNLTAASTTATTAKAEKPAETEAGLQDSLTCYNLVADLVFSESNWHNGAFFNENGSFADTDTVRSTAGLRLTGAQEVLNHTVSFSPMSNGVVRVVDSLTYEPTQTYDPVLGYFSPDKVYDVNKVTTHNIPLADLANRDSLFSKIPPMLRQWILPKYSRYFSFVGVDTTGLSKTTAVPEFDFALEGVRSGVYHIYVVVVPGQVLDTLGAENPYSLRFHLSWTDANNKQQLTVLPKGARSTLKISTGYGESTDRQIYLGDPGRLNVIDLGEFEFPVCYAGLDAYPSLMMAHTEKYNTPKQRSTNDQFMRVAGIYLVPKKYNDAWANSND